MELFEHQIDALKKMKNGCVLHGGVGSGKTFTAVKYYEQNEAPKDVYVITTARKRDSLDWQKEFANIAMAPEKGMTTKGELRIESWNKIEEFIDIEDAFFIFDEQRAVGSGAWAKAFIRIARRNNWIMLSATPGDTWLDYAPVFIANNLYKNRTQFIHDHVIYGRFTRYPKITGFRDEATLEKYRNMILVEMPYSRHTTRVIKNVHVEFDEDLMKRITKDRWHIYEDRPLTDAAEMFRVMRKLVNTDPSRMAALKKKMEEHFKLIVWYTFDYELDILRDELYGIEGLEVGEWNGHKKTPVPESDRWVYLVQYVSGAEAWNCVTTDAMVFWSQTYSYRNFEQAQGRTDRINTPYSTLYYYVLISKAAIDKSIGFALTKKESFNERDFFKNNPDLKGDLQDW